MLLYMLFFLGFKTEIPGLCFTTRMDAIQNFLELIWSLHVIVYVVFFLGFKTENPGWFVIT